MPDKRKHRGKHPDDERLFAPAQREALRAAVGEYSWLLTRGYATDSALKLVGDRHGLTARQRMAVRRSACSDQALEHRTATMITLPDAAGRPVGIDGYNLLITIESALSGALIIGGRDGCCRDLAGIHGTYRKVEETLPALEMIIDHLAPFDIPHIDWYLDSPVSNSGRLKTLMADLLATRPDHATRTTAWNIELVHNPDAALAAYPHAIVSSDSDVLDRCGVWVNLAADIIDTRLSSAWKLDLRRETDIA